LPTSAIAQRLGVSGGTVRRWFAEARPDAAVRVVEEPAQGRAAAGAAPTTGRLRQLYVQEGLSITAVAERLDSTTHLVRTWLLEDNVPIRPGGGRLGARRPEVVLKP
jgi:transposase